MKPMIIRKTKSIFERIETHADCPLCGGTFRRGVHPYDYPCQYYGAMGLRIQKPEDDFLEGKKEKIIKPWRGSSLGVR